VKTSRCCVCWCGFAFVGVVLRKRSEDEQVLHLLVWF